MRIAYVQMNCRLNEVDRNLTRAVELIHAREADLYVLPELFISGYFFNNRDQVEQVAEEIPGGLTCQFLARVASKKRCFVVAGIPEKEGGKIYNTSVLIGPDGWVMDRYRKIHLFDQEKFWFDPGDGPFAVTDIGPAKIGMMICFDWFFPESMRSLALAGAEIICHPANLVLPFCQEAMITRCLENRVFSITANRIGIDRNAGKSVKFTGKSQITAPDGTVLKRGSIDQEEIAVADIDPLRAWDKNITGRNHIFNDRRPEMYSL